MYRNILVPTDGSPLATVAVDKGLALAKALGAKLTALTVVSPFHVFATSANQIAYSRDEYENQVHGAAAKVLAEIEAKGKALGVEVETLQVEHEEPYRAIIDTATERGADLIAMASHGRKGLSAIVLGSETVKVLTHSGIPVLVYR